MPTMMEVRWDQVPVFRRRMAEKLRGATGLLTSVFVVSGQALATVGQPVHNLSVMDLGCGQWACLDRLAREETTSLKNPKFSGVSGAPLSPLFRGYRLGQVGS